MRSIITGQQTEHCKRRDKGKQREGSKHKGYGDKKLVAGKRDSGAECGDKVHKNPPVESEIIKSQHVTIKISHRGKKTLILRSDLTSYQRL